MVPSILRARKRVQVEVDPDAVFACPLDGLEEVLPAGLGEEGLVAANLDGPVG